MARGRASAPPDYDGCGGEGDDLGCGNGRGTTRDYRHRCDVLRVVLGVSLGVGSRRRPARPARGAGVTRGSFS